jgi:sulfite reductase alpha subunit
VARADCSIIGTWKDEIQMDQKAVKAYVDGGLDIVGDVLMNCPARCMAWDGNELEIDNSACRRCMHCINVMPKALRPGKERGATVLIGSKAPIVEGALLSSVLIPFIDIEEDFEDFKGLIADIWDLWCEEGKARERVGEFIQRIGLGNFLDAIGLDPEPEMVSHPRENPYVFYAQEDDDK